MAIQRETNQPGFDATAAAASMATPQPAAAPQQVQSWNFMNMGILGGISRSATSESLTRAKTALEEMYKTKLSYDRSRVEVVIVPIDNTVNTQLRLSSLAVCALTKDQRGLGVSYHLVLLDGTGEPLTPTVENWNGQPIPIDRFPCDVLDGLYRQVAEEVVKRAFPGATVSYADAQAVHSQFNWDNQEDVRMLAVNALMPDTMDLQSRAGIMPVLNLAGWDKSQRLQVQVNYNEPESRDYTGLPVRSDVSTTLTAVDKNRDPNAGLNAPEVSRQIARAAGYIELTWIGTPAGQVNQFMPAGQQVVRHVYAPKMVITALENQMLPTITGQLLGLIPTYVLAENYGWLPYFQPNTGNRGVLDLKDPGAINHEANIFNESTAAGAYGGKIKTKDPSFTQQDLGRLLTTAISPQLMFAIDVSQCGADSWYNNVFAVAAKGHRGAQEFILQCANDLTDGHFMRLYNVPGQELASPVIPGDETIFAGYYEGADGKRHDIRDIDYLAIMNKYGEKDIQALRAWSDTFLRIDYPLTKRLAERKKMIIDCIGGAPTVFTGRYTRANLNGHFLRCLVQAAHDCGLVTQITSPSFGSDFMNQRGTASYIAQAAVPMSPSGLFTPGYNGGNGVAPGMPYGGSNFFGRF